MKKRDLGFSSYSANERIIRAKVTKRIKNTFFIFTIIKYPSLNNWMIKAYNSKTKRLFSMKVNTFDIKNIDKILFTKIFP